MGLETWGHKDMRSRSNLMGVRELVSYSLISLLFRTKCFNRVICIHTMRSSLPPYSLSTHSNLASGLSTPVNPQLLLQQATSILPNTIETLSLSYLNSLKHLTSFTFPSKLKHFLLWILWHDTADFPPTSLLCSSLVSFTDFSQHCGTPGLTAGFSSLFSLYSQPLISRVDWFQKAPTHTKICKCASLT